MTSPSHCSSSRNAARLLLLGAAVALAFAALTACGGSTTAGVTQLPAPTFGSLELPNPSAGNGWATYSTSSPPAEVLPVRGRAVRINFYAPLGSAFTVSLRDLMGTSVATLAENTATPAPPPDDGYFQIEAVNPSASQAIYTMYVRAPAGLAAPGDYDIVVVNRSLRTDQTDSVPMVVPLRHRKLFTVTVKVIGPGHVTTDDMQIQCGSSPGGQVLTACSHEFGPGTVKLNPNSNDPGVTRFVGWAGNCVPNVQSCSLTLDGSAPLTAIATFGTGQFPPLPPTAAPAIPGLEWVNTPQCPDDGSIHVDIQFDATGSFCCESTGRASTRCPGKFEVSPMCAAIKDELHQPGGCYETVSFP